MATGYTAALYDGNDVEFPEFAMKCARGIGYLIELRDEPFDAAIPESFAPSSYHSGGAERAKADVNRIEAWDDDYAEQMAQEDYERQVESRRETLERKAAVQARYEGMLAKVQAWTPPTENHQSLKDLMISQLEESIAHDCNVTYVSVPERLTGVQYKQRELQLAREQLTYHRDKAEEEVQSKARQTEWVRALRQSLAEHSSATAKA